jgi:hypothetical protein
MESTFLILGGLVAVAAVAFLWWQSKTKGRFGINLSRPNCPRCATPMPLIRKPASKEEMMWGGWTCQKCGAQLDKYGKERAAA